MKNWFNSILVWFRTLILGKIYREYKGGKIGTDTILRWDQNNGNKLFWYIQLVESTVIVLGSVFSFAFAVSALALGLYMETEDETLSIMRMVMILTSAVVIFGFGKEFFSITSVGRKFEKELQDLFDFLGMKVDYKRILKPSDLDEMMFRIFPEVELGEKWAKEEWVKYTRLMKSFFNQVPTEERFYTLTTYTFKGEEAKTRFFIGSYGVLYEFVLAKVRNKFIDFWTLWKIVKEKGAVITDLVPLGNLISDELLWNTIGKDSVLLFLDGSSENNMVMFTMNYGKHISRGDVEKKGVPVEDFKGRKIFIVYSKRVRNP